MKLGTMRLMGTFGVPSYISLGDQYMKKIRASSQLSSELAVPGSLGDESGALPTPVALRPRLGATAVGLRVQF